MKTITKYLNIIHCAGGVGTVVLVPLASVCSLNQNGPDGSVNESLFTEPPSVSAHYSDYQKSFPFAPLQHRAFRGLSTAPEIISENHCRNINMQHCLKEKIAPIALLSPTSMKARKMSDK